MTMSTPMPKVLFVDDDEALRGAVKFSFGLDGLPVETFASAEALVASHDLGDAGCLVVDQNLPGMTGMDFLLHLRQLDVMVPAVLITTHPGGELRRRAKAAGVGIVEKPLLGDELQHSVRRLMDERRAS